VANEPGSGRDLEHRFTTTPAIQDRYDAGPSLSMSRSQRERRLGALPRDLEVLDFEVPRFA